MMKHLLSCLLLLGLVHAQAAERIENYAVEIFIQPSGQVEIIETIDVIAAGQQIRRGIYRDFPTRYRDHYGRRYSVPFEIIDLTRNDAPEHWHKQGIRNGVRVYFGSAERLLRHGPHRYRLVYRTARQIGFFDDFDELYWNAIGHDWDFVIESAEVVVHLPGPVPAEQLRIAGYPGRPGATGGEFDYRIEADDRVRFATTRPLMPGEGFTIAVGFPKGLVHEPTVTERRMAMAADNRGFIAGMIGLLVVLAWYVTAWLRVGRDPAPGAIYPRYQPPTGYSPGMLRYCWRKGYDNACFAAALVSLAVKGAIRLEKSGRNYTAHKAEGQTDAATEQALLKRMFANRSTSLRFIRSNHQRVSAVIRAHDQALSRRMEGRYFLHNRLWLIPGIAISAVAAALSILLMDHVDRFGAMFLAGFAIIWNSAVWAMLAATIRALRDLQNIVARLVGLLPLLFLVPFVLAGLAPLGMLAMLVGIAPVAVLVGLAIINIVFWQLIKAPTPLGRELLDQIEGLKLYLDVAERDEIEQRHSGAPPQTFEEFERLLPYAVALDAADTWALRFEREIESALRAGEASTRHWHSAVAGRDGSFSARDLSRGLGSGLASSTASAASAPGSSSGSGGGGW